MPSQSIIRIIRQLKSLTQTDEEVYRLVEELATLLKVDTPKESKPKKPLQKTALKSKNKIKPRSSKRQKEYDLYIPKREQFLLDHPRCQVTENGRQCRHPSSDIHHLEKRNGKRLLDETKWMAVCRLCHNKIGENPAWAYQQEFLFRVNYQSDNDSLQTQWSNV